MRNTILFLFICGNIFFAKELEARTSFTTSTTPFDSIYTPAKHNRHAWFVEFGGSASGYFSHLPERFSIHYEGVISPGRYVRLVFQLGSNLPQFWRTDRGYYSHIHVIPAIMKLSIGQKRLTGELGLGLDFIYVSSRYNILYSAPTGLIGLRYALKNNFFLGGGLTPTVGVLSHDIYRGTIAGVRFGRYF